MQSFIKRKYDFEFLIDGQPVLEPDADVTVDYEDEVSEESGKDESGVRHQFILREGVKRISLPYAYLSREEYLYMESLFKGKSEFNVQCRDDNGDPLTFTAYRLKRSKTIRNVKTGLYKNYNLNIVEC